MLTAALAGLTLGLSLIIVIGAQNAYVLRQGLRREHVGLVVLVCAVSDVILIGAGAAGMGAIAHAHPTAIKALAWIGAAYLVWCAIGSFRAAARPQTLDDTAEPPKRASVLLTVLGLTWLNPHVYLDTVVMLGSIAASWGPHKWGFALGAMSASILWFTTVGFGARALAKPLGRPSVWRAVDIATGIVMLIVAWNLATMH